MKKIDEDIDRLQKVYGDALIIEDCGTRAGVPKEKVIKP
jgi:hypothetical protein